MELKRELYGHPLFYSFSDNEIGKWLKKNNCKACTYLKNQLIMASGDPADKLGLILSGAVQIEKHDLFGNRNIFATLKEGELFSEAFAFSNVPIMTVDLRAAVNSRILLMKSSDLTKDARLTQNALKLTSFKSFLFDQRIEVISQRKTRDKLLMYLQQQRDLNGSNSFKIPYNRQELADYLGVERSGLSVEIHKLMNEKRIYCKGSYFSLL